MSRLLLALTLVALVHADVYMHSPRGSNDRNCEKNVNRNNGNRLFDSQNNNKGGYACPRPRVGPGTKVDKTYYHPGSKLVVEWTAQHGCGTNPMTSCEIVIQYACEDTLDPAKKYRVGANVGAPRDGTPRDANDAATDRIPENDQSAVASNTNTRRYGMHEGIDYYKRAKARSRNKGLYTADQNVRDNRGATATRQNPNGNRRGLEVPEERDYYPYWEPAPWRDIAVITSNPERCPYYEKESANVKPRMSCVAKATATEAQSTADNCPKGQVRVAVWWDPDHPKTAKAMLAENGQEDQWAESGTAEASWMAAEPKNPKTVHCVDGSMTSSRENQLGNSRGTSNPDKAIPHGINANRYIWEVPDHVQENCVLRLRYNISTADYWAWDNMGTPQANSSLNQKNNDRRRRNGGRRRATPPVVPALKSPVVQDPYVSIGGTGDFLSLAVNTNQYGRTFQDRSYVFAIRARPAGVPATAKIYNLGVRGKRGNIVQTYPAVEYDFVPNDLCIDKGDMVHFQWVGSDYNPRRNPNDAEGAGEENANGGSRADRSNLVEQDVMPVTPIGKANNNGRRRRGGAATTPPKLAPTDKNAHMGVEATGGSYPGGVVTTAANWAKMATEYKGMFWTAANKPDEKAIMKMAFLGQERGLGGKCKTMAELAAINNNNQRERDPRNCAKLNAVTDANGQRTPYFDGGLMTMRKGGMFSYMSTRNENFSNRNQHGFMCVKDGNTGTCMAAGCRATSEKMLLDKLKGEGKTLMMLEDESEQSIKLDEVLAKAKELLGEDAASKLGDALKSE
eukprot:TRINITY_DN969_c0_g1_i11.p1 TRINITY_DN969_c0_g1~~TRINITY_DN969_c0_g1_i11.p1  ORF type:complete len:793 (+),score=208.25 TRINITY_DN969_c0_g1_i11:217-2595(+)